MKMINEEIHTNKSFRIVRLGSKVKFRHNGWVYNRKLMHLDGQTREKVITPDSPVGQAIHGLMSGDVVYVHTPGGLAKIEILEIK